MILALPAVVGHDAPADARFEAAARDTLDKFLALNLEQAPALGDQRFDGQLNDRSALGVAVNLVLAKGALNTLAAIPQVELGTANRVDYDIFKSNLESIVFETDTVREWTWNSAPSPAA